MKKVKLMTSTFSRRTCLQVGSLSAFGLSLPTLLRAEADPVTKPAVGKRLKSVLGDFRENRFKPRGGSRDFFA